MKLFEISVTFNVELVLLFNAHQSVVGNDHEVGGLVQIPCFHFFLKIQKIKKKIR